MSTWMQLFKTCNHPYLFKGIAMLCTVVPFIR